MSITIDPAAEAGLTQREIRTGERDGMPTRIAVAHRTYPTDRADLWDALTSPERLPRWFLPISGSLEQGGRYQIEGNAGGTVERCDGPDRFAVTWEFGGQVSWLEVRLHDADGGTALELVHEAHVDPALWAQFGPGATGVGWDLALMGLGLHLATGAANDPAESEAWTMSPPGVAFVEASANGWSQAAVADGDDPEVMRAAAQGTVAFYTTVPDGTAGA